MFSVNDREEKKIRADPRVEDRLIVAEEYVIGGKALKASFDRFGDDLSELIVSYLTIEDKFRFQCLSKQWRRIVFNKTYVLKIMLNTMYLQSVCKNSGLWLTSISTSMSSLMEKCFGL